MYSKSNGRWCEGFVVEVRFSKAVSLSLLFRLPSNVFWMHCFVLLHPLGGRFRISPGLVADRCVILAV